MGTTPRVLQARRERFYTQSTATSSGLGNRWPVKRMRESAAGSACARGARVARSGALLRGVLLDQPVHVSLLIGRVTLAGICGLRRLSGLLERADRVRGIPGLVHPLLGLRGGGLGAVADRRRDERLDLVGADLKQRCGPRLLDP